MSRISQEEFRCYLDGLPEIARASGFKVHRVLLSTCAAKVRRAWSASRFYLAGDEEDIAAEATLIVIRSCVERRFVPGAPAVLLTYAQRTAARLARSVYAQRKSAQRASARCAADEDTHVIQATTHVELGGAEAERARVLEAIEDAYWRDPAVRRDLDLISELVISGGYAQLARELRSNRGTLHAKTQEALKRLRLELRRRSARPKRRCRRVTKGGRAMERIKKVAVVAVVLGAAATFAVHQRRQMTALETRQAALAAAVALTERTAPPGRAEGDALERDPASSGGDVEPAVPDVAAPTTSQKQPSTPTPDLPEPAEYAEGLGDSFAAERVDSAWERQASAAVTSRLAAHGDGSLRAVECRASMCRLASDDAGSEQARQQIQRVLGSPGDEVWSGAYYSHVEEGADGRPERLTYLFRRGASLPSL